VRNKIACLLALACATALAQNSGTVGGVVLDENSKPVSHAQVHIAEAKPFVGHRLLKFHETNDEGRFQMENVPWGTYVVMVGKEDAGYADTKLAFYSNLGAPTVTLAPSSPTANVTLKLSPKAGVLEIQTVTDTVTGAEVGPAAVRLQRIGTPFFIYTSAPGAHLLVPSMTDVSVEVTAPGYKPWPAYGGGSFSGRIRLRPQEVLKLDVQLQPE